MKESTHIAIPYGEDGMCHIQRKKITSASEDPLSVVEEIVLSQHAKIITLNGSIDKSKEDLEEMKKILYKTHDIMKTFQDGRAYEYLTHKIEQLEDE